MRRNNNQVYVPLLRNSYDLRSCLAVNDNLLDVEPRTVVAFRQFRQFAFG